MTDAELDALQKRLDTASFDTETIELLLFWEAFDAITYLRAQLSERDKKIADLEDTVEEEKSNSYWREVNAARGGI